jgi:hypothetical protein
MKIKHKTKVVIDFSPGHPRRTPQVGDKCVLLAGLLVVGEIPYTGRKLSTVPLFYITNPRGTYHVWNSILCYERLGCCSVNLHG